jgi:hypothetical protein
MARKASAAVVESHEIPADQTPGLDRAMRTINEGVVLDAQHDTTVRAIAAQIGYQLPADCTDPDLIQRDISANMRRSVEACLEVGRGLAVLKAACGHGNFIARLDVLGIEPRVAQKFTQVAIKLSNTPTSAHLMKAIGNQSKLFEMMVLDDEQLEELELTGQTGELHLDDIATMSVKELRAALRDTRANLGTRDDQIAAKNRKIDELDGQINKGKKRIQTADADVEAKQLREEVHLFAFEAEATILGKLTPGFEALAAHAEANDCAHEEFMAGCLCQIERALLSLRSRFNVKATPDGDEIPYHIKHQEELEAQAAANIAQLRANRKPGAAHV